LTRVDGSDDYDGCPVVFPFLLLKTTEKRLIVVMRMMTTMMMLRTMVG